MDQRRSQPACPKPKDGYVAPDVPAVVQAEDVKLSAVDMTAA